MKITQNYLRQIIKEELSAVLNEEAKTPESVIADLKDAHPMRRQMILPDFEAAVDDLKMGRPVEGHIARLYPGWTAEDFQAVINALR